ncbi:MAG TPA: hypothetical protein VGO03_17270 [Acidimicrobiia bacterium]
MNRRRAPLEPGDIVELWVREGFIYVEFEIEYEPPEIQLVGAFDIYSPTRVGLETVLASPRLFEATFALRSALPKFARVIGSIEPSRTAVPPVRASRGDLAHLERGIRRDPYEPVEWVSSWTAEQQSWPVHGYPTLQFLANMIRSGWRHELFETSYMAGPRPVPLQPESDRHGGGSADISIAFSDTASKDDAMSDFAVLRGVLDVAEVGTNSLRLRVRPEDLHDVEVLAAVVADRYGGEITGHGQELTP